MTGILAQRQRVARHRRPPATDETFDHQADTRLAVWPSVDGQDSAPLDTRLLARALTIRRVEERLLQLFAEGQLSGTVHTCIGQEWVGVAVSESLRRGDYLFSNHRGHGHYLAWTDDVDGLIAEIMGRSTGVCGGRGGSQHLCRDGFFSNGIQGGIVPVAAGLAMARRLEDGGNIAAVFMGDGTLGEGVVYETFNIAAKWSLPLLFVLEDNGVAQSTSREETLAGSIKGRAHAFGIDVREGDTWNPSELIETCRSAVRCIRRTRQPLLLHIRTYRLKAHSKGDDDRNREEVAWFAERDTLNQVIHANDEAVRELITAIDRRIDAAVEQATDAPFASSEPRTEVRCLGSAGSPPPRAVLMDCQINPSRDQINPSRDQINPSRDREEAVLPNPGQPLPHGRGSDGGSVAHTSSTWQPLTFESQRVVEAIRTALGDAMDRDERIVLLGEDTRDPYGGAFKVTAGLTERFGERVINTPISEAAIVGIGNGLALAGWRPVVEIMFGDFIILAADQIINHAAKFAWMYNHQVEVPLVIRTPMGGYRGYGPTHSQCLEKHLLGLPGTRVLALHKRCPVGEIYRRLLADNDRPTLVIENKQLYGQRCTSEPPPGHVIETDSAPFPTIRIKPPTGERQLTIVTCGGLVEMAESVLDDLADEDIVCDLIVPTQLYPLDVEPIVESVAHTRRLLVIEEGQAFASFGAELIARLTGDKRTGPFHAGRVSAAECPIPAAKPAELETLPGAATILQAAIDLFTTVR